MNSILLVEDNTGIAEGLKLSFELTEYDLFVAYTLKEATKLVEEKSPNLVLLDVSLPDGNGFDFYGKELGKRGIPVIFLTARDEENDIVKGLELGAEDYITKPFSTKELMARVKKVFARKQATTVITCGDVAFDLDRSEVSRQGQKIELSSLEIKILRLLFENHDKVVSRNAVIDCIWEATGNDVFDHTVTVYMKRIREKVGEDVITTVKGLGYRVDSKTR